MVLSCNDRVTCQVATISSLSTQHASMAILLYQKVCAIVVTISVWGSVMCKSSVSPLLVAGANGMWKQGVRCSFDGIDDLKRVTKSMFVVCICFAVMVICIT